MDEYIESLRRLVADVIALGPRSWPATVLRAQYGEGAIDYLLANEFLYGTDHLSVTPEAVHFLLAGGIEKGVDLQAKRAALGDLITVKDLAYVLRMSNKPPADPNAVANRVFAQLLRHTVPGLEFYCAKCWESYGICDHNRIPGSTGYYGRMSQWRLAVSSLLGVTESALGAVSPQARARVLLLRDHMRAQRNAH